MNINTLKQMNFQCCCACANYNNAHMAKWVSIIFDEVCAAELLECSTDCSCSGVMEFLSNISASSFAAVASSASSLQ